MEGNEFCNLMEGIRDGTVDAAEAEATFIANVGEEPKKEYTGPDAEFVKTQVMKGATNRNLTRIHQIPRIPKMSRRFRRFIQIRNHHNGQAKILSCDFLRVKNQLTMKDQKIFARQFLRLGFAEKDGVPIFCIGIMENGAITIEDQFNSIVKEKRSLEVKVGSLLADETEKKMTLKQYQTSVLKSHCQYSGLVKFGQLRPVLMTDVKGDKGGFFFSEVLRELERLPVLAPLMPWGEFSNLKNMDPIDSTDGPVFRVHPGEQSLRDPAKPAKERAEVKFLDRINCQAHLVEDKESLIRPAAHVCILQGIRKPVPSEDGYYESERMVVKEIVAFAAADADEVSRQLNMDLGETSNDQCETWVDDSKLSRMYREGIKYAKVQVSGNDIYFLPRHVIHQSRALSGCSTISWQVRLKHYYHKKKKGTKGTIPVSFDDPEFERRSVDSEDEDDSN